MLQVAINPLYFEVLSVNTTVGYQLAATVRYFGDNSAAVFGKICRGKTVALFISMV